MNEDTRLEKTKQIAAIREAFLMIEGEFDCIDIFNYIRKGDAVIQIPIDNIADALESYSIKGECKVIKEGYQNKPKKYVKTMGEPTI